MRMELSVLADFENVNREEVGKQLDKTNYSRCQPRPETFDILI
jgi:hypothetical protein